MINMVEKTLVAGNGELSQELESRILQYLELAKICSCSSVKSHLTAVASKLPSEQKMLQVTEILRGLAHGHRVKILFLLLNAPRCNCEIEALLGLSQSTISHHINELAKAGLIRIERKGRWSICSINPEISEWLIKLLSLTDFTHMGTPNVQNH